MTNPFTEDYFLRGKEKGLSNYQDYRWLEHLTIPSCQKIAQYLGMGRGESIIDIGCARGFAVKAFRHLGYRAYGQDISEWAITNCDPDVRAWVSIEMPQRSFDWATLKDLAEHVPYPDLEEMVKRLNNRITRGILFIVPLSEYYGGRYVRDEDEMDATHIHRWTLTDWIGFLEECAPDFNVNASYNIHGIKPASTEVAHSCGFFTLIRP